MGKQPYVSPERLKTALRDDFEALAEQVMKAVNNAPDGAVIAGSEFQVRDLLAKFREKVYQTAIQMRAEAAEAAFSPSGRRRRKAAPQ
jgi:hypothetical protein